MGILARGPVASLLFVCICRMSHGPTVDAAKQSTPVKGGDAVRPSSTKELNAAKDALARQKQFYSLFAGGFAGAVASSITCPIEVLKVQLQSSRVAGGSGPVKVAKEIWQAEGVRGFFRGLPPTLVGIIPSRASYFWAYSTSKTALEPVIGDGALTHVLSGIAAGVTGNTITNPIWMVKTRMQLLTDAASGQKAYTGYADAIRRIFAEEGFRGFWKGLSASYWGCSEGCIQFVVYEKLKKHLIEKNNLERAEKGLEPTTQLPPVYTLGAAAVSKFIATTTTYPHEVVRTRLREQARFGTFKYKSMWQSLALIAREEGRKGLYAGMATHVARVVPNTAIMFLSYEVINSLLAKRLARQQADLERRHWISQRAADQVGEDVSIGMGEDED